MFSSATQPPRHNFVVSAITYERFKLRSSNLTHALLIQISRTSSIIDIVVSSKIARYAIKSEFRTSKMADRSEMASNAIESDFLKYKMGAKKQLFRSEMARFAIESEFRTSKMADRSEMARNAIESECWTSKMADGSHFVKNFQKNVSCVSIWNGQKCDRKWNSDIQNGRRQPFYQKFQQKLKFHIDLKWPEMRSKVNFGHHKWAPAVIL